MSRKNSKASKGSKGSKRRKPSSSRKRITPALSSSSSSPSTVLDDVSSSTTRRPSRVPISDSSCTVNPKVVVLSRSSRKRENPLKSKLHNVNIPEEASVENLCDSQTIVAVGGPLDPVNVYTDKVRKEFSVNVGKRLAASPCNPERFLKPVVNEEEYESFLDREVDPIKVVKFIAGYMNEYYDLSKNADPFSDARRKMDDDLWDSLAYIIPMLCRQLIKELRQEPLIVTDIKPNALVFGDLHGNLTDLHYIFKHFISEDKYTFHHFVFLGDYVDRGPKPVEIICFLFALKLVEPERITLLRGNHEQLRVNRKYGFYNTCVQIFEDIYVKYPILADLNYKSFNRAFCFLPLAAVIKGDSTRRIFCCHGGVPNQLLKENEAARSTAWSINELNALRSKPVVLSPSRKAPLSETVLNELLWNDPMPQRLREKRRFKRKCFYKNKKRGGHCSFFTEAGLCAFLEANGLSMIIRGHQYRHTRKTGYKFDFDDKLLTVFSSSNYCGSQRNTTGYAEINGPKLIVTAKKLRSREETAKHIEFNQIALVIDERTKEVTKVVF